MLAPILVAETTTNTIIKKTSFILIKPTRNPRKEMFGIERLTQELKIRRSEPAETLIQEFSDLVAAFSQTAHQHDDMTMVILKTRAAGI